MKTLLPFIVLFLLLFTGCTSPQSTSRDFLEALNHHQFESALELVTEESKPILYDLISTQTQQIPEVEIDVIQCAAVDENDDHVLCLYAVNGNGESFEKKMHLIKEKNKWKVDLTREIE